MENSQFNQLEEDVLKGTYGEIHSVILIREGYLIYEKYFNGWNRNRLQSLQSVTKSIIATYMGAALQTGLIGNLDQQVYAFFPEVDSGKTAASLQELNLRDLLTMRSGFLWEYRWNHPDNTWNAILQYSGDWYRKILELPFDPLPGTRFQYQSGNPTLVSGIVQSAARMPIQQFAVKYLFEPLNISRFRFWDGNGGPQNNGSALLYLRPVDLAKIGYLYLNGGRWKYKQILPQEFVEKATAPQVVNAEENPFYRYDYGYFWWVNPRPKLDQPSNEGTIFLARGAGGQNLIVWPRFNIVCVITAWNLEQPNRTQTIFDNYIMPAVFSN